MPMQTGSTMANTEKAGGTRFSEGKPGGWWYAPLYGLRLVAEVWQSGAEKYAPMDWRNGQSFSTLMDCAYRHMMEMNMHGPLARDDGEGGTGAYHAACVVWNLLTLLTFIALGRHDLDDVTGWQQVTTDVKRAKGYSFENPPPSPDVEVKMMDAPGPDFGEAPITSSAIGERLRVRDEAFQGKPYENAP